MENSRKPETNYFLIVTRLHMIVIVNVPIRKYLLLKVLSAVKFPILKTLFFGHLHIAHSAAVSRKKIKKRTTENYIFPMEPFPSYYRHACSVFHKALFTVFPSGLSVRAPNVNVIIFLRLT